MKLLKSETAAMTAEPMAIPLVMALMSIVYAAVAYPAGVLADQLHHGAAQWEADVDEAFGLAFALLGKRGIQELVGGTKEGIAFDRLSCAQDCGGAQWRTEFR